MSSDDKDGKTHNNASQPPGVKYIKLSESRLARHFRAKESFWDAEITQMNKLLLQQHEDNKSRISRTHDDDNQPTAPRNRYEHDPSARWQSRRALRRGPMLTIALFGSHGSGKSSLLKTFVNQYKAVEWSRGHDATQLARAYALPVIEPSLVHEHDLFLYVFLAEIWQVLDERRRTEASADIMSPAERAFQRVVENLRAIDDDTADEADAVGRSLYRLERHRSDKLLRDALAELIETVTNEVNGGSGSLLILPVDDADISFRRLRDILDTCRRFLRHPQLVLAFSFTSVLAEELLGRHYTEELNLRAPRQDQAEDELNGFYETFSPTRLSQELAAQFLGRLFPIQHRIRVRMGALRVRMAQYEPWQASGPVRDNPSEWPYVWELLRWSTFVSFGCPEPLNGYKTKRVLKPSGLRQQLQLLDSLARVKGESEPQSTPHDRTPIAVWADAFDDICWTIFGIHRSILRRIGLYQEELYGWHRLGLRSVILQGVLKTSPGARRKLIENWRHGSVDNTSQILSLLAAYTHRPPVPGGEDYDPDNDLHKDYRPRSRAAKPATNSKPREQPRLASTIVAVWFLDLWFGFYLPCVVSVGSNDDDTTPGSKSKSEGGDSQLAAGWKIENGARHAIIAARRQHDRCLEGILFFDPKPFLKTLVEKLDDESKHDQLLMILLWCQWGVDDEGTPWAALNLWRALSLAGLLLLDSFPYTPAPFDEQRVSKSDKYQDKPPLAEIDNELLLKSIKLRLCNHLKQALIPKIAEVPPSTMLDSKHGWLDNLLGVGTRQRSLQQVLQRPDSSLKTCIDTFTAKFQTWKRDVSEHKKRRSNNLVDLYLFKEPESYIEEHLVDDIERKLGEWDECALRRLHGEYVIGEYWTEMSKLSNAITAAGSAKPNDVIRRWHDILVEYWNPKAPAAGERSNESPAPHSSPVAHLFESCPIFDDKEVPSPLVDWPHGLRVYPTRRLAASADEKRQPELVKVPSSNSLTDDTDKASAATKSTAKKATAKKATAKKPSRRR